MNAVTFTVKYVNHLQKILKQITKLYCTLKLAAVVVLSMNCVSMRTR